MDARTGARFEEAMGLLTHAVSVFVDDVDVHFERAVQHGVAMLGEPKDQPWGVRSYAVLDPEVHQWEFAELASNLPEVAGDGEDDD